MNLPRKPYNQVLENIHKVLLQGKEAPEMSLG